MTLILANRSKSSGDVGDVSVVYDFCGGSSNVSLLGSDDSSGVVSGIHIIPVGGGFRARMEEGLYVDVDGFSRGNFVESDFCLWLRSFSCLR